MSIQAIGVPLSSLVLFSMETYPLTVFKPFTLLFIPPPQTGLTPLQESLEGDEPDIVRLLMRAESKVKKKVCCKIVLAQQPSAPSYI